MAENLENDQWLYDVNPESSNVNSGEPPTNTENKEGEVSSKPSEEQPEPTLRAVEDDRPSGVAIEMDNELETHDSIEDGEVQGNGDDSEKDNSDDDVNVVIGDIKVTAPSYTFLNIKRRGLLTSVGSRNKQVKQQQPSKFVVEDFKQIGTINGVPAMEFNVDSLEDKPWRKPGADITDYFNFGFNEDTWRAYCERQKRMRVNESNIPIMSDNSKYAGSFIGMGNAGPPCRKFTGGIDVIGAVQGNTPPPVMKVDQVPRVNTIQVITADRREYSRKPADFPNMTDPLPATFENFQPEYGFYPEPEPFYGGYEPTQDSQWGTEPPGWVPSNLQTLNGPPAMGSPPMHMGPPPATPLPDSRYDNIIHKERDLDREMESRIRSERPRDRDRKRSHKRDRSRNTSRKHKSRSRSPSHSHRRKKSKRHEDSD